MARLIKRYGNRKLYDTQESRYVTLEDISSYVKAGEDVRVVDNDSADDLTAVTFAQIILEEERREAGFLPVPLLRRMIQQGEAAIHGIAERVDKEMGAIREIGEKAGRRVQELVTGQGSPDGRSLVDDLISKPQRRLQEIQRSVDEGLKDSVERFRSSPAIQRELGRIERSLQKIEELVGSLGRDRQAAERPSDPTDQDPPSP